LVVGIGGVRQTYFLPQSVSLKAPLTNLSKESRSFTLKFRFLFIYNWIRNISTQFNLAPQKARQSLRYHPPSNNLHVSFIGTMWASYPNLTIVMGLSEYCHDG